MKGIELRIENNEFRAFLNGKEVPRKIAGKPTLVGFEFSFENSIELEPPEEGVYLRRQPGPELELKFSIDPAKFMAFCGYEHKMVKNEDGTFSHIVF